MWPGKSESQRFLFTSVWGQIDDNPGSQGRKYFHRYRYSRQSCPDRRMGLRLPSRQRLQQQWYLVGQASKAQRIGGSGRLLGDRSRNHRKIWK
jgi:hypothetical protein